MKDLKQLKNYIIENEGATVDHDGAIKQFKNGFMVSIKGFERCAKSINFINNKLIMKYSKIARKLGGFIGFWVDNNKYYIDISIHESNKNIAILKGLENNQIAIFDCEKNEPIYL